MLTLLFARDLATPPEDTPATTLVPIPPDYIDFKIENVNVNGYVRFITGFEIIWALGNQAVLRCDTIDPYQDDPTDAYRTSTGEAVEIRTRDGLLLFNGTVLNVTEKALGEPNSYVTLNIEATDRMESLTKHFVTSVHGGEENLVAIAIPGNPTVVQTAGEHGFATGDTIMIREVAYASGGGIVAHPVNGQRVVTVISSLQFSVPVDSSASPSGQGGSVRAMALLRDIVISLQPALSEHGITVDPLMADGPWLEKIAFDEMSIADILRYITSTTGWLHRLLPEGVLQFFEPGSVVAPFQFTAERVESGLKIRKERSTKANRVIVKRLLRASSLLAMA
jgi:hypothetical protein